MTTSALQRRGLRSGAVLLVFIAGVILLAWIWQSMRASSAAFADRETFDDNRLGTGTVDISIGEATVRFAAFDMAAGDVTTGRLELVNTGTFALNYDLSATADGAALRDVLDVRAWRGEAGCAAGPSDDARVWWPLRDDPAPTATTVGRLAPGESDLLCLDGELPLSATNTVQGSRLDLTLTVYAEHDLDDPDPEDPDTEDPDPVNPDGAL